MGILSWKFRIVLFLGSVVVFLLIARFVKKTENSSERWNFLDFI